MQFESQAGIKSFFAQFSTSVINGVPGVMRIQGSLDGPTTVISVMTHGPEDVGLYALEALFRHREQVTSGTVVCVIGNLPAAQAYMDAGMPKDRYPFRKLQHNLNRLPPAFPEGDWDKDSAELQRAALLQRNVFAVYKPVAGLDIHSADQPFEGGLSIDIAGDLMELNVISDVMPAALRLTGISPVQLEKGSRTKSFGTLFGGNALEVEASDHDSPEGKAIAFKTVMGFLMATGNVSRQGALQVTSTQEVYPIKGVIMVPHHRFKVLSKDLLENFAVISEGTPMLQSLDNPEEVIRMPFDGHGIFGPTDSALESLQSGEEKEEVFFPSGPCVIRNRTTLVHPLCV